MNRAAIWVLLAFCLLGARRAENPDHVKDDLDGWPFDTYLLYTQVPVYDSVWCHVAFNIFTEELVKSVGMWKYAINYGIDHNIRAQKIDKEAFRKGHNRLSVVYDFIEGDISRSSSGDEDSYQYCARFSKTWAATFSKPAYEGKSKLDLTQCSSSKPSSGAATQKAQLQFRNMMMDGFRYLLPLELDIDQVENQGKKTSVMVGNPPFPVLGGLTNVYFVKDSDVKYHNLSIDKTNAHGRFKAKALEGSELREVKIKKKKDAKVLQEFAGREGELKCVVTGPARRF